MMLGGEAQAGRLLVGRVDWPTSSSFPSTWKETQEVLTGEVHCGKWLWDATREQRAVFPQRWTSTKSFVPVSLGKRRYLGSSSALNQEVGHTLFSFSRKAGRIVTVSVSAKHLPTMIIGGN